ncbi:hypothetical protein FB451DRAFT_1265788 [Mycena latifolia]|nr:hypothetical protein FB451DRAFT_1265788 [Mycena latifolia]
MPDPFDLKKVGKLFDEALRMIRDNPLDTDTLEPQAIAWLKDARYNVMRKIEASYYELERSRDSPLCLPAWVDPTTPLYISTDKIPTTLRPYNALFTANLLKLLKDCGFQSCSAVLDLLHGVTLMIYFPHPPGQTRNPLVLPETLDVEDDFARMAQGAGRGDGSPGVGGFAATDFGRLLMGARGEVPSGSKSGAGKKRRASREVKEEIDTEGPRLRSMTRASSAATLRSGSSSARRSPRKRMKREEV